VIYGWTIAQLVRHLSSRRYVHAVLAGFAVVFALNALDMAWSDAFAPLPYARWCAAHPGPRERFWASNHAESVADRMAGPHDEIAIHGGRDAWIYPAYGVALSRTVSFAAEAKDIPGDAEWVVIDQVPASSAGPDARDLRFYEALLRDARFQLVYRQERTNQALFRRKEKGPRV